MWFPSGIVATTNRTGIATLVETRFSPGVKPTGLPTSMVHPQLRCGLARTGPAIDVRFWLASLRSARDGG